MIFTVAVHLDYELSDTKVSVGALHEDALLLGVRPLESEKFGEPVPESAPRYSAPKLGRKRRMLRTHGVGAVLKVLLDLVNSNLSN